MSMEEYLKRMTSGKGMLWRSFLYCKECGFVWTTLGQANFEMEGTCPACCETNFDYAPKEVREKFIKGFKEELEALEKIIEEEGDS